MFTTPYFFYVWIPLTPLHMLLGVIHTYLLRTTRIVVDSKKKSTGGRILGSHRVGASCIPLLVDLRLGIDIFNSRSD